MANIYTSAEQLIGNTPILELTHLERALNLKAKVLVKLECFNPAGSIKDRVAKAILSEAEKNGTLKPGGVVIEPTSGNTGIGLAAMAAMKGYRAIIVMPDSMSMERRKMVAAYGAELILTPGEKGMSGAIEEANRLREQIPGSMIAGQFTNPVNVKAHYETTGPEIYEATEGKIDILIAGVGTGGTITGTGRYLKEKNEKIRVVAVEPKDSAVLSGDKPCPHKIQGIGAGFVPEILDTDVYDEICQITTEEAFEASRMMAGKEGLLIGISSGAALSAAIAYGQKSENEGKNIVVILPDGGDRYFSTPMFSSIC